MIDELLTWGTRLFKLLPECMGLYKAAKEQDAKARVDAQLAMARATERLVAEEEIAIARPELDE